MRFLSFDVGTKNLAQCDLSVDAEAFAVHSWSVGTCVAEDLNVNKTPIHVLAPEFSKTVKKCAKEWLFEANGQPKPLDRVFIENQPMGGRGSARNLKTKILSHVLQCMLLDMRPDVPVTFVHPGLKLKDMPRGEEKNTYRQNKLYAIEKTTELVSGPTCSTIEACKKIFVDAKKKTKKDDLADAFLQGLFAGRMYARGDVIEPEAEKKKAVKEPKAKEPKALKEPKAKEPKAPKRKVSEVIADEALKTVSEVAPEMAPEKVPETASEAKPDATKKRKTTKK